MSTGDSGRRVFDRSTAVGRRAEMEMLDAMSEAELLAYDVGHRFVTTNPESTSEREAQLAAQLEKVTGPLAEA